MAAGASMHSFSCSVGKRAFLLVTALCGAAYLILLPDALPPSPPSSSSSSFLHQIALAPASNLASSTRISRQFNRPSNTMRPSKNIRAGGPASATISTSSFDLTPPSAWPLLQTRATSSSLRPLRGGIRSEGNGRILGGQRGRHPSSRLTVGRASAGSGAEVAGWDVIAREAGETPTGQALSREAKEREAGGGRAHTDATLRLFGHSEDDVRLTLYRDKAAWCPYCQKVWIMLEEKKIPYRISHINMRSYGHKPDWFLAKVPGGLLPAIELDGKTYTESLEIMRLIDQEFPDNKPVFYPAGEARRIQELYQLERNLFAGWCEYMFRPESQMFNPFEGMALSDAISSITRGGEARKKDSRRVRLEGLFSRVDSELGKAWEQSGKTSPWFLGGEAPSLIDLQFITHVERMEASLAYWKAMRIRGAGGGAQPHWPHLERWMEAFEAREAYQATKSDYYTHVMNIPPQYGYAYPDVSSNYEEVRDAVSFIGGESWNLPRDVEDEAGRARKEPISRRRMQGRSWTLPVPNNDQSCWEPIRPPFQRSEEAARHEAAFELASNYESIVKFACRGTGDRGEINFSAPLADPYALANPAEKEDVDLLLRMTAQGLVRGQLPQFEAGGLDAERREELAKCIKYVRDRVGVPRDMSFPAAQHLRAYLNHIVDILVPLDGSSSA